MKAAIAALSLLLLLSPALALSAEFVGQKQVTLCTCDSTIIPIVVENNGHADAEVMFESRGSTGILAVSESRVSVPAGSRTLHNIYAAASCDGSEGYASIAAKATDASTGGTAHEAGVVRVVQCGRLSLKLDKSAFACGESEYGFTLANGGTEPAKGTFSTNLLDSEYTISEREFNVPAGQSAGVVLRVKVDDASRGTTLVLTANGEKSSSTSATALLEKIYCAGGNGGSAGGSANGNGGNGGSASGSANGNGGNGLFGPLSGFFTLGLTNFSLEWTLLALAVLLIAFFYYTVRQLEVREVELDRRVLAR